jgi:hypothetical protein
MLALPALGRALLRGPPPPRFPRGRGARVMSRALVGRRAAESPLVAELRARIADKDAELRARIADKDVSIASKDAELRARIADKDGRIADKDAILATSAALFAQACAAHAKEAELLRRDADLAQGRVSVRAVLEACLEDVAKSHGGSLPGKSRSHQLARLLAVDGGCAGLVSYLRVAAGDNSLKEGDLLKQAQELFGALSGSLHAEESGGTTSAPAALFDPHGRTKMVAMAAIARFTGRNLALYGAKRDSPVPIKLRVLSPLQRASCALSVEEVRAAQVLEF